MIDFLYTILGLFVFSAVSVFLYTWVNKWQEKAIV